MATAHDVAAYILERQGGMSAMKLQKLVYYAQAWNLAWLRSPLFGERIEAWAKGPVVRELYARHRGYYTVARWPFGSSAALTPEQRDTVDRVLSFYGDKSAGWLSALTHAERPWKEARMDLPEGERGEREITRESMMDYYGSL